MGFITKYGSLWGTLPVTSGRVYWVAASDTYTVEGRAYPASDGNDGLSPERAFRTIDYAVGQCTANVGDVIVLLPGAHSSTTTVTVDVAGVTITGLPRGSANLQLQGAGTMNHAASVTTTLAAAEVFTVTADRTEIAYLTIIPITAGGGISLDADDVNVHNCVFDMATPAVNAATEGIQIAGSTAGLHVSNCTVRCDGAQGPFFRDAGSDTITLANAVIERCTILASAGTWDDVFEILSGATNVVIRDCDFQTSGAAVITDAIDVTGNTTDDAVWVGRCYIDVNVTNFVTATATSDVNIVNNYRGTVEGGTGGVLLTT